MTVPADTGGAGAGGVGQITCLVYVRRLNRHVCGRCPRGGELSSTRGLRFCRPRLPMLTSSRGARGGDTGWVDPGGLSRSAPPRGHGAEADCCQEPPEPSGPDRRPLRPGVSGVRGESLAAFTHRPPAQLRAVSSPPRSGPRARDHRPRVTGSAAWAPWVRVGTFLRDDTVPGPAEDRALHLPQGP